jgi:virginiamycin B lyase
MNARLGIALCAAVLLASLPAAAETGAVAELVIPTPSSQPVSIVTAPDGALWFTESAGNKIGRLTLDGVFDEYAIPTAGAQPDDMGLGPDGNLWFAETSGNKIGRITTDGVITEYPVATPASQPNTVRPGPDPNPADDCAYQRDTLGETGFAARYRSFGDCVSRLATTETLWFSEQNANRLAQITTDGDIFEYQLPTPRSQPGGLAQGPDGAVWFTELAANQIGRLDVKNVGKPTAPGTRSGDTPPEPLTGAP